MDDDNPPCSFCDKRRDQVEVLIARPGGVAICGECVDFCNEIIADARARQSIAPVGPDQGAGVHHSAGRYDHQLIRKSVSYWACGSARRSAAEPGGLGGAGQAARSRMTV